MNVLGFHFGHDGSVCVVRDGAVVSNVLRERLCRQKHALSVDSASLNRALSVAGLKLGDIDFVAVSSTQHVDLILNLIPEIDLCFVPVIDGIPASVGRSERSKRRLGKRGYADSLSDTHPDTFIHPADKALFLPFAGIPRNELKTVLAPESFPAESLWSTPKGLNELARTIRVEESDLGSYGLHYSMLAKLDGRAVPAAFVHHHVAHAASSFYRSGFSHAAIFTQDGYFNGMSLDCGGFFWGDGKSLYPLSPHYMPLGHMYEAAGQLLRLGALEAPGKLMGLAPYGRPTLYDPRFVGNAVDFLDRKIPSPSHGWIIYAVDQILKMRRYNMSDFGQPTALLSDVNVDFAASAQKVFEENRVAALRSMMGAVDRLGLNPDGVCLSGGVSLNCPANTRMACTLGDVPLFVEPNCDDGGIAVGAALYLTHHLLRKPRPDFRSITALPSCVLSGEHPFAGGPSLSDEELDESLARWRGDVTLAWTKEECIAEAAAKDIAEGLHVGWFQGPAEIGPRALGRRSFLADPRDKEMWKKVNVAKEREQWRPFAPAVLATKASDWFADGPLPSPYMIFTHQVTNNTTPSITHVDGTARIQTVSDDDRPFADLLRAFERLTGIPVVLNTSLNGRGEPIVETPEQAFDLLAKGSISVLFIGPYRVIVDR